MIISNDISIFEALEKFEESDDELKLKNGILSIIRPEMF